MASLSGQVVINEVDYDQPGTDGAEFVELKNIGAASVDLSTFTLQLINGNGSTVYQSFALPAVSLAPGAYFVVCGNAATVASCDLDVTPDTNLIQNGAPDAVALLQGGTVVDALSYEGSLPAPFVEGSGAGLLDGVVDMTGLSRFPDGVDSDQNNVDFSLRCITPGAGNTAQNASCSLPAEAVVVINEIDYDQPGTDSEEFIELTNVGTLDADLSAFSLQLINGSTTMAYATINLPAVTLAPGAYFVICANSALTIPCDLDVTPDSNLIQNGAPDAVALLMGATIVDTVSYEGDVAGFTEGSGVGLADVSTEQQAGISRFPDGADSDVNNIDFSLRCVTPGAVNTAQSTACNAPPPATDVVINEVDYDQAGTDGAEFVEILNNGTTTVNLGIFNLQLINGNGAAPYNDIALPAVDLGPGEYFVVCGNAANVFGCDLDSSPDTNFIQNGAPDAVALFESGALVDSVSYEGDTLGFTEGSGVGLQDSAGVAFAGISRFPDGADSDVNNVDFSFKCITPGLPNIAQSSGCFQPGPELLVINEIDYDQPGTDAAEFVELKNVGGSPLNLANFTLELVNGNGGLVYNVIVLPAITLVPGDYFVVCGDPAQVINCDLDASPNTNLIQNGAPDAAALFRENVLVDALSYEGDVAGFVEGSGVGLLDNGALQFSGLSRFPDGADTDSNNVDFRAACVSPGTANTDRTTGCTPEGPSFEIFEIQGAGFSSPLVGQFVTTLSNVVTGVASNGFFIQTPSARTDGDPLTSDGVFVFTSSAPTVSVGDAVTVSGQVVEFFDFTELGGSPSVTVTGTAVAPPPVLFDALTPSPLAQAIPDLERFEGMLVQVVDGVTTGPSDRFGDIPVTASNTRTFREPGIEFPGMPPLPVWDGNPEVFEIDPDGLGLPDAVVNSGTPFTAVGALGFSFGDYQLLPLSVTFGAGQPLPQAVRPAEEGELTLATLNTERLFAGRPETPDRLLKFARYVLELLGAPDVVAVQEVDTLATLQALADQIALEDPSVSYSAFLEEGNDVGGIDVGFLVKDTVIVDAVTQIGKDVIFSFDGSLLNDRPPLILDGTFIGGPTPFPFTYIVVHHRSLNGIADPNSGERVRLKRFEQARWLSERIQEIQSADPQVHLAVAGDFNAFEFTDGFVDVLGQVTGIVDPTNALVPGIDLVDPDLRDHVLDLAQEERYTFIFQGNSQVLDHVLTSQELTGLVSGIEVARANSDAADLFQTDPTNLLRSSDHDGVVLYVQTIPPPATASFCSNLGNNSSRFFPDKDDYLIDGLQGEQVSIRLEAHPNGSSSGNRATLALIDQIRGVFFLRINAGDLPNFINVTLPADGRYRIKVEEQFRFFPGIHFLGDYCLGLESSGPAAETLRPTSSVEQ